MNYTVQEVADKMGITSYTIRYYENQGMIPHTKRDENNHRIFDDKNLEWIKIIIYLRNTGMPLKEIKKYLKLAVKGEDTVFERYQTMLKQQQRTINEINNLNYYLQTINRKVTHYAEVLINHKPDYYTEKIN